MKSRFLLLSSLFTLISVALMAQPVVKSLKADYKTNPMGIDNPKPMLSWIIQSESMNTIQDSYEVRAALSDKDVAKGKNLLWESGKVESSQSIHVKYGGPPLNSFQLIYWQVRIIDNHGKSSKWSEVAQWEMGVMDVSAWKAEWISPSWEEDPKKSEPSPYLRKEFALNKDIASARLYISCHGLYRAEINGNRIGDQEFTPGWTSYDTRLQYQTYDVTGSLKKGENAVGIILGDGWFRGYLGWVDNKNIWGSQLAAIGQLVVTFSDGTSEVVGTDNSWKASTGPILESDIYNGEVYDATKELGDWSSAGYDDAKWEPVIGVQVSQWGIKKMKTRWGACNIAAKRIWLNLELAKKPPECLSYILVHEMVHLLERHHNVRFKALMDGFMSQWRLYQETLNRAPLAHEEWYY